MLLSSITIYTTSACNWLSFIQPTKELFLMLPLTYKGLADTKGLISIYYIRLGVYILAVKRLKYVYTDTVWLGYSYG